jgi:hypothetical protein
LCSFPSLRPLGLLLLSVAAGCETSSGNLYFLSAQRIGLEVAASDPASNASPKILIGYESVKGTVNLILPRKSGHPEREQRCSSQGHVHGRVTTEVQRGVQV